MHRALTTYAAILTSSQVLAHDPTLLRVDTVMTERGHHIIHIPNTDRGWRITCATYDEAGRVIGVGSGISNSPATKIPVRDRGIKLARVECAADN